LNEAQLVELAAALALGSARVLENGEIISMKKFMNLLLGMFLLLSAAASAFAQDEKRDDNKEQKTKVRTSTRSQL
jgi:hypothetical protein